ncbi:MAG: alpha/beta fold hydrolase [Ignavibacteria bacterium]
MLYSSTRIDFFLTLSDGVILDCTKFIPNANPPSGGWPSVILCHGFGLSKYSELPFAEELSTYGYYTLVYSMRGQGISTGASNFISTTEMNDLIQVTQYVRNETITNDNKICITGGSQGGIIPFMSACYGNNVRTIVSDLASPEFASSWIENGSIKMTLLWTLSYPDSVVRYNNLVSRFRNWILSSQSDKWDSLAYYLPQNRDFMNRVQYCQVPVLISNAWQDKFFNTLGMIRAAYILPYNSYRMYFGAMPGHGSDYYDNEIIFHEDLVNDWFDYWLYDIQNGVMDPSGKFTYASTTYPLYNAGWSFTRSYSPTWPPNNGGYKMKLYFLPQNRLRNFINTSLPDTISFLNDVRDTTLTMLEAVNYEFTGTVFNSKFNKTTLTFDTEPLHQDFVMAGTPLVSLKYSSTANLCQYNFQIWEVRPSNTSKLVSRINFTDRNYTPNSIRTAAINGISHSHIFRQGNRIRVIATNLDNQPLGNDIFLRTNPHALPVLKIGRNKIYMSAALSSYIEIPLREVPIGIVKNTNEIPENFKLYQNYPNPFNPITKIKFDLPERFIGGVKLKIFDLLGKEITTLIDEKSLSSGTYEINWDAQNYSNGIYFYQLETNDYKEVKKMVLVK